MNVKHPTHPSERCECDTCELEHQYTADETELRIAVNPYTGTVVELDRTEDGSGWIVTVTNHKQDGSVLFGWRAYDDQGDAFDVFWRTAEWAHQ